MLPSWTSERPFVELGNVTGSEEAAHPFVSIDMADLPSLPVSNLTRKQCVEYDFNVSESASYAYRFVTVQSGRISVWKRSTEMLDITRWIIERDGECLDFYESGWYSTDEQGDTIEFITWIAAAGETYDVFIYPRHAIYNPNRELAILPYGGAADRPYCTESEPLESGAIGNWTRLAHWYRLDDLTSVFSNQLSTISIRASPLNGSPDYEMNVYRKTSQQEVCNGESIERVENQLILREDNHGLDNTILAWNVYGSADGNEADTETYLIEVRGRPNEPYAFELTVDHYTFCDVMEEPNTLVVGGDKITIWANKTDRPIALTDCATDAENPAAVHPLRITAGDSDGDDVVDLVFHTSADLYSNPSLSVYSSEFDSCRDPMMDWTCLAFQPEGSVSFEDDEVLRLRIPSSSSSLPNNETRRYYYYVVVYADNGPEDGSHAVDVLLTDGGPSSSAARRGLFMDALDLVFSTSMSLVSLAFLFLCFM